MEVTFLAIVLVLELAWWHVSKGASQDLECCFLQLKGAEIFALLCVHSCGDGPVWPPTRLRWSMGGCFSRSQPAFTLQSRFFWSSWARVLDSRTPLALLQVWQAFLIALGTCQAFHSRCMLMVSCASVCSYSDCVLGNIGGTCGLWTASGWA